MSFKILKIIFRKRPTYLRAGEHRARNDFHLICKRWSGAYVLQDQDTNLNAKEDNVSCNISFCTALKGYQSRAQADWLPGRAFLLPLQGRITETVWKFMEIPKFLVSAGNRNLVAWSAVSHRHRHECHYSRILNYCTWLCTTSNSLTVREKCDIMWLRVTATQSSPTISSSFNKKTNHCNTLTYNIPDLWQSANTGCT